MAHLASESSLHATKHPTTAWTFAVSLPHHIRWVFATLDTSSSLKSAGNESTRRYVLVTARCIKSEVTSPFQPAAANPPPETADDDDDDMEDIEVDEMGLGEVLEDEEIQAMLDGIAKGRVDPDAAAQADADFEDFLAEVRAEAETSADSASGESA